MERVALTIASSEKFKLEIQDTLDRSKAVDDKYEKFKSDFGNVMSQIIGSMSDAYKVADQSQLKHKPIQASAIEAANYLKGCKNIMILTGAGLSAASGIPTFRGANGFWTQKNFEDEYSSPEEILTMVTFNKDPSIVWKWHYDFIKLMNTCKPNEGHKAI